MRSVRLIGGEADGAIWRIPAALRHGDIFRVYVPRGLSPLTASSVAPPIVQMDYPIYKLCEVHIRADLLGFYAVPVNCPPATD